MKNDRERLESDFEKAVVKLLSGNLPMTLFAGPQAPAFRPEIGPFRLFNLVFSAARYTAG